MRSGQIYATLGTTEDGAYTLDGYTGNDGREIARNPRASVFIPSEDEWYKAAYYDRDSSLYYDYPTGTDSPPSNDLIEPDPGNNANFQDGDFTIGSPYWRTEIAEFENSESPYGTCDQGGNVYEWNETPCVPGEPARVYRGGAWFSNGAEGHLHAAARYCFPPASEDYVGLGFRVAEVTGEVAVISWRSVRMHDLYQFHGGPYECAIVLDHTIESGCATTEPRQGGIRRIEVDFNAVPALCGPVEAQNLTDGGTIAADDAYIRDNGDGTATLIIIFDPGTLPDVKCYEINLADNIPGLTGDTDCRVIALEGDSDGDCNVTLTDALRVKDKNGPVDGCEDAPWDLDCDWNITLTDFLRAKDLNGHAVTCREG